MWRPFAMALPLAVLMAAGRVRGGDLPSATADRAAVERVYYAHRLGTKPPFEQTMPPNLLARLVALDAQKESALRRVYGVMITDAMVDAECRRIDATTRAPAVLAEIKAALGNDPARFARSMARPIVVERELRQRFDNDDALHAPQRRLAESARAAVLAATNAAVAARLAILKQAGGGAVNEVVWQLTRRTDVEAGAHAAGAAAPSKAIVSNGAYRIEATVQLAQGPALTPQRDPQQATFFFEDLPDRLQQVLRAQLRQPGDISAVVETDGGFTAYLLKAGIADTMQAAVLSIPKRSYDDWLGEQGK